MDAPAPRPEFARESDALARLTFNFHNPSCSVDECLTAVYGADGARCFWNVECSEPVPVAKFIKLLTVTLDRSEFVNWRPDLEKQVRDMALGAALVAAYQAGSTNHAIFAGDLSSLETARYGHQLRSGLKVHVRKAGEWLLEMPLRKHLVPLSLARFIASTGPSELSIPDSPAREEGAATHRGAPVGGAAIERKFRSWSEQLESRPTKRDAEEWAKNQCPPVSVRVVRELHHDLFPSPPGRPRKNGPK